MKCPVCGAVTLCEYGGERGEAGPFARCTNDACEYDEETVASRIKKVWADYKFAPQEFTLPPLDYGSQTKYSLEVFQYTLEKLSPQPGDIVVVKCNITLSVEILARVQKAWQSFLPSGVKLMLVQPDTDVSLITKANLERRG